jgi:hypothetical protein
MLLSCGREDEPQLAKQEAAVLEEQSTCSAELLGGACRGPWAYHDKPCYRFGQHPSCPPETYTYVKSCFHAEPGLTSTGSKDLECGGSGCTYSFLNGRCGAAAIARANTALGDRSIIGETHSLSNFAHEDDGRRTAYCQYTLNNAGTSQHAQICGLGTGTRDGSCRTPALGLAPASECGTSIELQSSVSGLFKAQLQANDVNADLETAQCSTLEDVAVGPQRLVDSVARSSATDAFWSTLPASTAEEAAARADLVKQAKLMFELGVSSPAANLDEVRTLYSASPDQEFGCGVPARAPVSDGCRTWGASDSIDGALGLCQRMLSSHVAPSVFAAEMDRCLDVLQRPESDSI